MKGDDMYEVTWQADDGYVGNRPQSFNVRADELPDEFDEKEVRALFNDLVQDEFSQTVSWTSVDEEAFVEWAREQIARREHRP